MPVDLCDLAAALRCSPAPDDELFKFLTLRGLLAIIESSGGGSDADVLTQVIIPGISLTNSYADTGFLLTPFKLRSLDVTNATDVDIDLSFDGGVTTNYTVPANSKRKITFGGAIFVGIGDIKIKRGAVAATIGSVTLEGSA